MLALDRKLWRDLVHLRGQAFAIAAVMASGLACFLMFLSTLDSLQLSRESYYRDYRFAEIFAPLKRAPESVRQRIAEIEGVDKVDARVVAPLTIDIEGFPDPVTGVVTSIPDSGDPLLNRLYLRSGRLVEAGRSDLARLKRVDQRRLVMDRPARDVDETGRRLHQPEGAGIDQMVGLVIQRA